jgi:hypothetical protein
VKKTAKKQEPIDWAKVEAAIRRAVCGRATAEDNVLFHDAFQREPEKYGELSKRVRGEEQEAYRKAFTFR